MRQTLFLCSSLLTAAADPCCRTCDAGKAKFYSIPTPTDPNAQCGECCLEPKLFKLWKLFEPKLEKGDCGTQGYTQYVSTETDGVWPLSVANDRYVRQCGEQTNPKPSCPQSSKAVYADMHDGDKKEVTISDNSLIIKPSGNNQTWVVKTRLDRDRCVANVDFNVPGKPNPPPVNLTASLWYSASYAHYKTEWEFTDPTGTLASKDFPLNRWVELEQHCKPFKVKCLGLDKAYQGVFADMHDGDKKEVIISGTSVTIKPSGNKQTWVVNTTLDTKSCTAKVDFDVPGKPNPPPVSLLASFLHNHAPTGFFKYEVEFTDPSGTLAPADFPLNHWVELEKMINEIVI